MARFVLTGSQNLLLMEKVSQTQDRRSPVAGGRRVV
jgi:hypothetical protein